MIFSQASKYAIRALIHLAEHAPEPQLSREIARAIDVPGHFLAKILQDLSRVQLLQSFKGRGGGFKLAKSADQISLLEIVQAMDGPGFGQHCLLGLPGCSEIDPCPLHEHWVRHSTEIMAMLRSQTLALILETNAAN